MLAVVVETTTIITHGKPPSDDSDDNRKGTPTILLGAEIRRGDIDKWPDEVRKGDDLWAFESHLEIKFGELCVLIGMTNVIPKCALDENRGSMILDLL